MIENLLILFCLMISLLQYLMKKYISYSLQYNLDQATGQLQRCDMIGNRKDCKTLTVISRIRTLWHHIKISRSEFEAVPDTGLLSKVRFLYLNKPYKQLSIRNTLQ